jgi:hypothetical protein
MARLSRCLCQDHPQFRPKAGTYSPYGAVFGSPSDLIESIALKALQLDDVSEFGLEDVLADGDAAKLAWVNGWRKLPHVPMEVQKMYEYPQAFAEALFERIESELQRSVAERDAGDGSSAGSSAGRLFVSADADAPDLPVRFIVSSDGELVAAGKAEACELSRLLGDSREGYFLASYATPGGWVAIKKDLLTEVLGAGQDAKLAELPPAVAATVRLMCLNIGTP